MHLRNEDGGPPADTRTSHLQLGPRAQGPSIQLPSRREANPRQSTSVYRISTDPSTQSTWSREAAQKAQLPGIAGSRVGGPSSNSVGRVEVVANGPGGPRRGVSSPVRLPAPPAFTLFIPALRFGHQPGPLTGRQRRPPQPGSLTSRNRREPAGRLLSGPHRRCSLYSYASLGPAWFPEARRGVDSLQVGPQLASAHCAIQLPRRPGSTRRRVWPARTHRGMSTP